MCSRQPEVSWQLCGSHGNGVLIFMLMRPVAGEVCAAAAVSAAAVSAAAAFSIISPLWCRPEILMTFFLCFSLSCSAPGVLVCLCARVSVCSCVCVLVSRVSPSPFRHTDGREQRRRGSEAVLKGMYFYTCGRPPPVCSSWRPQVGPLLML